MKKERSLLSSAKEFLIEALTNYKERKYQFAILHAVTATELVLKERLVRVNPALIFRNIDSPHLMNEQTVALGYIPQRLANLGMPLDAAESMLIRTFAGWRNQIVHQMPAFDSNTAERQLPQLLDTLALFLRRDLSTPLETFLPKQLYRVVLDLLKDWKTVVQTAAASAETEGGVLGDSCPQCGGTSVMCLRADGRVYCHLCKAAHYRYDRCDECGRQTVSIFSAYDTGNVCDDCIEAAGDRYIQQLIDIERGK
jgi:hypothetical protein